jgi:hypothetical protein
MISPRGSDSQKVCFTSTPGIALLRYLDYTVSVNFNYLCNPARHTLM